MVRKVPLETRVERRIARSKASAFVPADFTDLSDRDQVLRALRKLIHKGAILRVGYGVYARTKISTITKKPIPEQSLRVIAVEALQKNGVTILPTAYEREYNAGESTQVPTGLVIGVNKRVSKRISFNGRTVKYEKTARI